MGFNNPVHILKVSVGFSRLQDGVFTAINIQFYENRTWQVRYDLAQRSFALTISQQASLNPQTFRARMAVCRHVR